MSNRSIAVVQKDNIKLTEYTESTYNYEDRFFIQSGCVGFYVTKKELKDLRTVIDYYLNADEITEVKVYVDGEHVAI